jgi:D-sedoheptulose 7-phosphate isomerase
MSDYRGYMDCLKRCLDSVEVSTTGGAPMTVQEGLNRWLRMTKELMDHHHTMFFVGNGASAMMAAHMAADASKNSNLRAMAFNDPALLTAVSNDISYEQSFALPLRRFGNADDILVTISSSGGSPNIIAATAVARELKLQIITLSGMKPDNPSRQLGDLNFYVPSMSYGITEAAHQSILHCWLDAFMTRCVEQHDASNAESGWAV